MVFWIGIVFCPVSPSGQGCRARPGTCLKFPLHVIWRGQGGDTTQLQIPARKTSQLSFREPMIAGVWDAWDVANLEISYIRWTMHPLCRIDVRHKAVSLQCGRSSWIRSQARTRGTKCTLRTCLNGCVAAYATDAGSCVVVSHITTVLSSTVTACLWRYVSEDVQK